LRRSVELAERTVRLDARAAEREGGGFHERRLGLEERLAKLDASGQRSRR